MDEKLSTPNPKTVLMVEDDPYMCDLYTRRFQSDGFTVTVGTTGEEAISKALNQEFDVIILDVMIPEPTGLEVLKTLRQNEKTKTKPIFLLSNLGQEAIIQQAFKIGVNGYFLKSNMLPRDVSTHIKKYLETNH